MTPGSERDREVLIRRLVEVVPCSECGSPYQPSDVHVVAREEAAWVVSAFCPSCGTESIILAYLDAASVADITPRPPDCAEVAAWRDFLDAFDGDLRDLLAR
jgi:hypothetical protein